MDNTDRTLQKITCAVVGAGFAALTGMFIACIPTIWGDLNWSSLGEVYTSSVVITVISIGIVFFAAAALNGLYTALFNVEL